MGIYIFNKTFSALFIYVFIGRRILKTTAILSPAAATTTAVAEMQRGRGKISFMSCHYVLYYVIEYKGKCLEKKLNKKRSNAVRYYIII